MHTAGLILGLRPANERRRYKVTPSLIGWALQAAHNTKVTEPGTKVGSQLFSEEGNLIIQIINSSGQSKRVVLTAITGTTTPVP